MKTRRALYAVGATGMALALSACFKMDVDLELNTEDTVDGTIIMAFSQEFRDMAEMMGEDMDMMDEMFGGGFGDFEDEMPDYASVEPYDDGEFVGQQVVFDGAPLDEFDGGDVGDDLRIYRDGEEFVVTGTMDMTDADPDMADMEDMPPGMFDGMMDFDLRVAITFPGEVIEHNGELSGTTVTWEPQLGETNDMFARAQDSGGGGGVPVWVWIVVALVIVAGLVALVFVFSRSKGDAAPAAGEEQVPAPTTPGAGAEPTVSGGETVPPLAPGDTPPAAQGETPPSAPTDGPPEEQGPESR